MRYMMTTMRNKRHMMSHPLHKNGLEEKQDFYVRYGMRRNKMGKPNKMMDKMSSSEEMNVKAIRKHSEA